MKKKRFSRRVAFWFAIVLVVSVVAYALHAAHLVTSRMGGQRWKLPSRIYAAAGTLYPGVPFSEKDFRAYLGRLGYQEVKKGPAGSGQWFKTSSGMEVGFRSYRDSVGAHPPMTLDIRLAEGRVGSLRDLSSPGGK
ncbi:MAG: hypothetical protein V1798_11990, partial [Pseudomonadota bacterium]